jgi:hypothetical protein
MISLICIILAAICNAVMDRLMIKYINLPESRKDDYYGWYSFDPLAKWKRRIWGNEKAYNVLFYKLKIKTKWLTDNCNDAWHFFKSLMIIFLALSVVFHKQQFCILIDFLIFGFIWNVIFNTFYNKILKNNK